MLESWRLQRECRHLLNNCLKTLDSIWLFLEEIKPLGDRELSYIVAYVRDLKNKLAVIEQGVSSKKDLNQLNELREKLRMLHRETQELHDQLRYLAKLVPSEILKYSLENLAEFCSTGRDVLGIIANSEKIFAIVLQGLCRDISTRVRESLENDLQHLEWLATANIHPCIINEWHDFLRGDLEKLNNIKGMLEKPLPNNLKELCKYLLELQETLHFVESEVSYRFSRYREIRDRYLSPEGIVNIVPLQYLKLFESPEDIYKMFSPEFREEFLSLAYMTGREREAENLLKKLAYCLYQLGREG